MGTGLRCAPHAFTTRPGHLRADLDEAQKALRNAKPEERLEVQRRFKDALYRFSAWVFAPKAERRRPDDPEAPMV